MDPMDFEQRRRKTQTWLIVLSVAFLVVLIIFGRTILLFIAAPIAIAILLLMWLHHSANVKEDEARGDCKGRNRVGSVQLSGVILCLIALVLIAPSWESLSITDPTSWLSVTFASFFVLRGVICWRAGDEYDRTINRVEQLESELERRRPKRKTGRDDT